MAKSRLFETHVGGGRVAMRLHRAPVLGRRAVLHVSAAFATGLVGLMASLPASAQSVTASGNVNPFPGLNPQPNWTVGGDLRVGDASSGSLNVANGGSVSNGLGYIGNSGGSVGDVTVTGTGSTWTNSSYLYVGYQGAGTLNIAAGGAVSTTAARLGALAGGTGAVTVTGTGSTLASSGFLMVGEYGAGTLNVTAGGRVTSASSSVSSYRGASGAATVSGAGSLWTSGGLYVGENGDGTLRIEAGGAVSSSFSRINLLQGFNSAVTVTGNSTWTHSAYLYVGSQGNGTLRVEDGSAVSNSYSLIGLTVGSLGTITVTGANSTWTNSSYIELGRTGGGALTVADRGAVSNLNAVLGSDATATGTALVTGPGSIWTNNGDLTLGRNGRGALTIADGGAVRANIAHLAFASGSAGVLNIGAATGQAPVAPGTLNVNEVRFGSGTGLVAFNHTDTGYTFTPVFTGTGAIRHEAGTTVLTGDSRGFAGAATVFGGTLLVNGQLGGTARVLSGGRLGGIGTVGTTTNEPGGVIAPGNSIGMLTIKGDYIGNGGLLEIETELGDDTSPSDVLVIDGGTASGVTQLQIINMAGQGALTTGNGILVVDPIAGGTSAPNAFSGSAAAGPYNYTLYRGGLIAGDDNDWFLRSAINCAAPGAPSPPCLAPGPDPDPDPDPDPPGPDPDPDPPGPDPDPDPPGPGPDPDPQPAPIIPDYRIETSLYTAIPALAAFYGRSLLDNLHDRVGEQEQLRGRGGEGDRFNGGWVRAIMWDGHHEGGEFGIYSEEGPEFKYDLSALQLGLDLYRHEHDNGQRDHLGTYLAYGQATAEVDHVGGRRAGTIRLDGFSVGGYWTHYWDQGAYLDAVAQYTFYDVVARSPRMPELEGDGDGWALSLEGGYPFRVGGDWVIEPQGQIVYQTFDGGEANDIAAQVHFESTDSLIGRLGLRVARTWADGDPEEPLLTTGWARLNYKHEFLDSPVTSFSSEDGPVEFVSDLGADWLEVNAGVTRQISSQAALLLNGGYQWNLDKNSEAWTAKLGMRFNW